MPSFSICLFVRSQCGQSSLPICTPFLINAIVSEGRVGCALRLVWDHGIVVHQYTSFGCLMISRNAVLHLSELIISDQVDFAGKSEK
jgi:hypothetical protein